VKKRCYEDGAFLQFCTPEQQDNITIAITAVCNRGSALKFCSPKLRDDVRLVKLALKFGNNCSFIFSILLWTRPHVIMVHYCFFFCTLSLRWHQHWFCLITSSAGPWTHWSCFSSSSFLFHEMGSSSGNDHRLLFRFRL